MVIMQKVSYYLVFMDSKMFTLWSSWYQFLVRYVLGLVLLYVIQTVHDLSKLLLLSELFS